MEDYGHFTVDVPADFDLRFAAVFRPMSPMLGNIDFPPRYGFSFEAELLPDGMDEWLGFQSAGGAWKPAARDRGTGVKTVRASSRVEPLVIPGHGSTQEINLWQSLLWFCDNTNIPRDFVFRQRAVRLLVQPFEFQHVGATGIGLVLRAIKVSDLSEGFLRRYLKERLKLMEEMEDND